MDQFGKFQKISSWFDPENPLMDVRNDSGILTHINGENRYDLFLLGFVLYNNI